MLKRPLSKHYPILKSPIQRLKIIHKNLEYLKPSYNLKQNQNLQLPIFRVKKHKSVLRRKLGDSNPKLQEQKVKNLAIATEKFNGLVIKPNQIFSFWKNLGEPKYSRGFTDGMILDNGKVIVGLGGGLCQMANLLYWLFLHTPLEVKEHHHHLLDIFPDSGRVLPFGSGAGVLYNYGDLQFANKTENSFYLKVCLDDKFLHGEIYTINQELEITYKIIEREHFFYKQEDENKIYRTNKIYRLTRQKLGGRLLKEELITYNNSEVLYEIDEEKMAQLNTFYKLKQIETDRVASQIS
jgi:vancomycin resistance protein VanW